MPDRTADVAQKQANKHLACIDLERSATAKSI